jgi:hypothetical protein
MHPDLLQIPLSHQNRELERRSRTARLRAATAEPAESTAALVLRLCSVHDDEALDRLAALEGQPPPAGRHLVAEVDGTVVAALPLGPGRPLADPFRKTAHLLPLLELRARQLAPTTRRRGRAAWSLARGWSRACGPRAADADAARRRERRHGPILAAGRSRCARTRPSCAESTSAGRTPCRWPS